MALKRRHKTDKMAANDTKTQRRTQEQIYGHGFLRHKNKYTDAASFSIREKKGFEIQTWDIRNPPKRASLRSV